MAHLKLREQRLTDVLRVLSQLQQYAKRKKEELVQRNLGFDYQERSALWQHCVYFLSENNKVLRIKLKQLVLKYQIIIDFMNLN